MIQELFIENTRVDLTKDQATLLTLAIDDIKDFGAKNTGFSKTIVLPGSKTNDTVFNYFFDVNIRTQYNSANPNMGTNFNAAAGANAILFSNRIQSFKGIIRLIKIITYGDNSHEYEVLLFGELSGLINKIGNKKLDELSFTTDTQYYDMSSIAGVTLTDSITHADYVYPLADYGTYSTNKHDWKYRTFRPAVYVKNYIEKIFSDAGYTLDMPLLSTTRFEKLVVPYNRKDFTKLSNIYLSIFSTTATYSATLAAGVTSYINPAFATPILGTFTYSAGIFTNGASNLSGILNQQIKGRVHFSNYLSSGANYTAAISIKVNGSVIQTTVIAQSMGSNPYWHEFDINVGNNLVILAGQTLAYELSFTSISGACTVDGEFDAFNIRYVGDVDEWVVINLGETFQIKDIIPKNYLQKTFLSDVVKLFNLYLFEDKNKTKHIKASPFPDFYNDNTNDPVDWSLKIDRSKPISVIPMGELNARYYQFNYAKDNDYWNELYFKRYNETYGSRLYDSEFEFAKETEKVELQFAGTPLVGYIGEDKVYSTIFKQTNGIEERVDSAIRILQYDIVTGVTSFNITNDAGTTLIAKTTYIYAGHLNNPDAPTADLNFGAPRELFFDLTTGALNVNQFNVYWSSYMAEITDPDSKIMEAWVRLSVEDIDNLDFSQKIYIDGQIWRINKIIDYNASLEDICKIELLNIINTTY